jgi:hypothetical protein
MDVKMPDGTTVTNVPDDVTQSQLLTMVGNAKMKGISTPSVGADVSPDRGILTNIGMGALKGASDIGATLLTPVDWALNKAGVTSMTNDQRRASLKQFFSDHANPDSWSFKGGELGADIAGTAGVGGLLGKGVALVPGLSAALPALPAALRTGGFSLGGATAKTGADVARNIGTRILAGAANGAASGGLINPSNALPAAAIGGVLPVAVSASGALGSAIKSSLWDPLVNPDKILGGVMARATGGASIPAVGTSPATSGVRFSLGQSSGSPAINAMEDAIQSSNAGGPLGALAQSNRSALSGTMRDIAQGPEALAAAQDARRVSAKALYDVALDPANQQPATPWIKGQITQLLKRPSINEASKVAQKWALERGEQPLAEGSLPALHDVKTAIDDMIAKATLENQGGRVSSLQTTKDQLLNVMDRLSPAYAAARANYADMSRPINQMQVGQYLADKLIPATAGDIPSSLNAATLARALQHPDQVAKTATKFSGATLPSVLEPAQFQAINGVNSDASRIAEMSNLGAGARSPTARRTAVGNYIGSHFEDASPTVSRMMAGLGAIPGINYLTNGVGAIGSMAAGKINGNLSGSLEEMLANDPQKAIQLINQFMASKAPASGLLGASAPFARQAPIMSYGLLNPNSP